MRSGVLETRTFVGETHILLKLCVGFADSVFQKHHGLPVGPALHGLLQGLCHRVVEQRLGRRAMNVAGGESGDDGGKVHMDAPEPETRGRRCVGILDPDSEILNLCDAAGADE